MRSGSTPMFKVAEDWQNGVIQVRVLKGIDFRTARVGMSCEA